MWRPTKRQIILGSVIAVIIAMVAAAIFFRYSSQLPPASEIRAWLKSLLQSIPAPLYFVAFAILPAFGAPLTLFYLTALPVMGQTHPVVGVLLAWCALAINMVLSYWFARGILHPAIEWVIRHRQLKIPKINPANELEITLAVRLSPLPFPVQNYLLALGHTRWRSYLFLSLPIQGSVGIAMMFLGKSIISGHLAYVLVAAFLLIVIVILTKTIRRRLKRDPLKSIN